MKVLFTGTASSHCKSSPNTTFFGLLAKAVSEFAEVVWAAPRLSWTERDLEEFDAVIFGLTPPTSLSANKIYGAMHLLGLMYHSPKLRLVIDSPQIWQYKNSIEAVKRDVSSLFSSFYSKRAEYSKALKPHNYESIKSAAQKIATKPWPRVIFPVLPWSSSEESFAKLGFGDQNNSVGLNLDSILLDNTANYFEPRNQWAVDNIKSSWYKTLLETITFPGTELKVGKSLNDYEADLIIRSSAGLIVTPQDRGVGSWWSYRHIQALNAGTPVVTYWQDTTGFDSSWSVLGYQVEDMTSEQRKDLAKQQYESYAKAIPSKRQITEEIETKIFGLTKEKI
jgi:hypothetical protein